MRKSIILLITIHLALFIISNTAYAFSEIEQECIKCHIIDTEKAKLVLRTMIPGVKVLNVQNRPMKGLWEIGIESGKKKGIVYIDYSYKYLIAGNIFSLKEMVNLTEESLQEINKIDLSLIPYENALVMGDKKSKKKVAVFDDPE